MKIDTNSAGETDLKQPILFKKGQKFSVKLDLQSPQT